MNSDLDAAWRYHNGTKHSYQSVYSSSHYLDWRNQPLLFKVYPKLDPIPLPRQVPQSGVPALSAISTIASGPQSPAVPDLNALALLLHFSAGVTKQKRFPGGETFFFRAAACTGALYEFELYLVCGDLPGLDAGVYHFGVADFSLHRLRPGGLARSAGRRDGRRARRYACAACDRLRGDVLAERLEVPGADLPPFRLGQRDDHGQPVGDVRGFAISGQSSDGLCG
jgi:hypothetical protein